MKLSLSKRGGKQGRTGFLSGLWVSRPFALVYTNSIAKSSKKALLSYVVFNNSVINKGSEAISGMFIMTPKAEISRLLGYIMLNNSVIAEIVVLTPFFKGEAGKMTLMTLSLFLASSRYWRPDAICDAVTPVTQYILLRQKTKKNFRKNFYSHMSRWLKYRHCPYSVIAFRDWRPKAILRPLIYDAKKLIASSNHFIASFPVPTSFLANHKFRPLPSRKERTHASFTALKQKAREACLTQVKLKNFLKEDLLCSLQTLLWMNTPSSVMSSKC